MVEPGATAVAGIKTIKYYQYTKRIKMKKIELKVNCPGCKRQHTVRGTRKLCPCGVRLEFDQSCRQTQRELDKFQRDINKLNRDLKNSMRRLGR